MRPLTADLLVDVRAIEQLKYDYCWAYDEGDLDALVALFTPAAVCSLGTFGIFAGHDEIGDGYARIMSATGIPGTRRHVPSCPQIEIDGDHGHGRWYLVDFRTETGAVQPVRVLATYRDEYVRVDGAWRFSRVDLDIKWVEP